MNATQEKIIELARDLIQRNGYQSFSYKQIADVLLIKNAAVHHYYPAKEDLGIAVIEKDKADFVLMSQMLLASTATEKTDAVLQLYTRYFFDGNKLCMISSFGAAFEGISEKMQFALRSYLDAIATWLTHTFNQGLENGDFHFAGSAEDMASKWITGLPGALVTGRIRGESYFNNAIKLMRESLQPI